MKKAVVLTSGGLDSTTCLAIALAEGYDCYTLTFDYGQKHRAELEAADHFAKQLGATKHQVFALGIGQWGGSALTDQSIEAPDFTGSSEIPVTYVPTRNTIFLSIALGYAEIIQAFDIFIGVSAVDYSHYPDCRPAYIAAFQQLADLATKEGVEGTHYSIHAPLISLSKAETIRQGLALGIDYSKTISCYRADEKGLACGKCDSCMLRKKGFAEAGMADPTRYATH